MLPAVHGTIHSELPIRERLDIFIGGICLSVSVLPYFVHGFSLPIFFGILATLMCTLAVLLSPVYSSRAYKLFCLSPPLNVDSLPSSSSLVVLIPQEKNFIVRPLLFRYTSQNDNKVPRFEFERKFYEFTPKTESSAGNVYDFDLVKCPTNLPLSAYASRLTEKDTRNAQKLLAIFGENKFDVPLPELKKLMVEQAQSPFFLFQVFCVCLWMLDEYWYFAVFTLLMLVMFEGVVAQNRLRNIEVVRNMLRPDSEIFVKRAGSWRRVFSGELVPLDVIKVEKNQPFPCDAILIHGNVVVNEAMLTGECTPKMKFNISEEEGGVLDLSLPLQMEIEDSPYVVLGGTMVLDCDKDAVAVVLRTGYETTQGQLMRVILHSTDERVTVDSNREAYVFMFCLVVVASIAAVYVLVEGLRNPNRSHWKLFLHSIMIVTSVVPAELPVELSLAITTSLSNLIQQHGVYCTEPYRIPSAGKVDVCCFDKTGTLTSDDLVVEHIVNANDEDVKSSRDIQLLLACSHSLVVVKGEISGDTTELAAWRFLNGAFKVLPTPELGIHLLRGQGQDFYITKRFAFDAVLRRMSVLVSFKNALGKDEQIVFCKGAPESIQELLDTVPTKYVETYQALTSKGFRVLALSQRKWTFHSVLPSSRSEAESHLEFLGFLCLSSPLKADSRDVVQALKASGHRVVIVTGDSENTASAVGRQVGISLGKVMTGKRLVELEEAGNEKALWEEVNASSVFARVSPNQKERIVTLFRDLGKLVTLFVGDGSNDSLALKRADVGISVISHPELERLARNEEVRFAHLSHATPPQIQLGDASIASAFTTKTPHVSVLLDIIRQGRCTLVTTIQMFKILAVNGLLHSFSLTFLFLMGVRQGDTQSTIYGLVVAVVFALLSFTQSVKELAPRRPISRIFSPPVLVSVAGQSWLHLFVLNYATSLVSTFEVLDPDAPFAPNPINSIVYIAGFVLQANIFACNYRGSPFMTPFFENRRFSGLIVGMWIFAFVLSTGMAPTLLLDVLELVELPSEVSFALTSVLFLDTLLCLVWEFCVVRLVLGG